MGAPLLVNKTAASKKQTQHSKHYQFHQFIETCESRVYIINEFLYF